MKSIKKIFFSSIILISMISCSYKADFSQKEILAAAPGITLENHGSTIVINPSENTDKGLIFYPGGLVNYESYLPLMVKIAQKGIKCFIVEMPSDLAIFDISAANPYAADYPQITNWYLGGHSLGGAMAATHISKNVSKYKGLIFLAGYSTKDISASGLKVLSIYGSNDKVLKKDSYNKFKSNLPADFTEIVIAGGNHGNFGNYGHQKGDGESTITRDEQQNLTADYIGDFCK